jgi:hypothetical protein
MTPIRERHVYCYVCPCGRKAKTLKKGRARDGRCKYCRQGTKPRDKINPNQIAMPL